MKVFPFFKIALVVTVLIAIALLVLDRADTKILSKKIGYYDGVADSLRTAVESIRVNVRHKDSILLVYLASLDRTLEELNKESSKNKIAIRQNFLQQDSIRANYCRQMFDLQQKPDECNCD